MPAEQKVIDAIRYVEQRRRALIDCAARLVAAPSPNPPGDERAAAEVARAELASLGFTDLTICGPAPERANLICRFDTGKPGPALLLNGHLDTKPEGDRSAWHTDPYEPVIRDGRLYGLGAVDMKGPDAALVYGLAAAAVVAGDTLRGQVLLVLSADEEGSADDGARYLVNELGLTADAALIAEPCGVEHSWESIPLISRGFCGVRFLTHGTPLHSSLSDRVPSVNASLEASRLMLFLRDNLRLTYPPTPLCPLGPTVNLGARLEGGRALAIVSAKAEFWADIRTLPGMTQAGVRADLEAVFASYRRQYPGALIEWEFVPGTLAWTQPTQIAADHPIVQATAQAAARVLGSAPQYGYFPGGTDAVHWQGAAGIPTLPAFGPGLLSHAHRPNESVGLDEMVQAAQIYALTIISYLSEV